jgi:hypothetical protein
MNYSINSTGSISFSRRKSCETTASVDAQIFRGLKKITLKVKRPDSQPSQRQGIRWLGGGHKKPLAEASVRTQQEQPR